MHNTLDKDRQRSVPSKYRVLLYSLLFSALPPVILTIAVRLFFNSSLWPNNPLHSLIESLGSFASITLAIVILIMRRNRQLRPSYLWIACTLMGMGVLDLFHASMPPGNVFIWFRSLAMLLGGFTFALVLLPERWAIFSGFQCLPWSAGICSACAGVSSLFLPEHLPEMGENEFSFLADCMNSVGGLGFFLAWFYFCMKENNEEFYNERVLLANFSLLFAVSALLFDFSTLWSPIWWLMDIVRLFAYAVLLVFFLKLYSQNLNEVRISQRDLKKRTLELERTQRRLSDIIKYSPAAITLKDINGKFILVNRRYSGIFPDPYQEPVGKTATDLFSVETAQQQRYEDEKVLQQGTATENEEEYRDADGQKRTFIVDRFPLKDSDKEIYGVGSVMTEISERKKVETERKRLLAENTERIKELNCLYGLSRLAENSDAPLTDILQKTAELIAASWRYDEHAGAQIIIDDYETVSINFQETKWSQEAPIFLDEEIRGRIQVCYNRQFPDADEGPFLQKERHLINEAAVRLGNIIQRKNAEIELRKAFEFNKKIIEEFPVGLSVYDKEGKCIATNSCMKKITGFPEKQQFCTSYHEIDYWHETGLCAAAKQSIALHANLCHNFKLEDASDGTQQFLKAIFVPFMLRDEQRLLLMIEDITERKEAEEELKAALLEKESLLKEIHHRVKNNMQIVASLMFLQAQDIKNQEAIDILQESQDRVKSMSLVHELLYQAGNLAKVPFKEYVENLVSSLRQSYNAHDVLFQIKADPFDLPISTAIPCGLILNELITNSIKHAFKHEADLQSALLSIRFQRQKETCVLSVRDNGAGFPSDYDWDSSGTLGLNLIRTLSTQLDAELAFESQDGLTCRLRFPV